MPNSGRLRAAARSIRRTWRNHGSSSAPQLFPAGAFYSPVVNADEVLREPDLGRIWPERPDDPAGFDLRADAQLALLEQLAAYRMPSGSSGPGPHYDPANDQFPLRDAQLLYAMVRHLRPKRMVEVGCGWSTTVTARAIGDAGIDTELTCIDPFPVPYLKDVRSISRIRAEKVEHTPMELFEGLRAGDVMFIDSSHVAKTGSDVVHQFLNVLPRLADGVVVHVHDIFIPEDYPREWVRSGFGWNEQYLLQAFLIGNERAHVLAMNHWLMTNHPDRLITAFGDAPPYASSAWLLIGSASQCDSFARGYR